jgi:UDP-N-acetylglucosamine transferase subunit ALG13
MDMIAGKIDEKVIMQIGSTKYKPVNAEYFDFEEYSKMQQSTRNARVVISHAGVGSILTAFEQRTPIIVVPRLKKFAEAIDDHQLEIAEMMSKNQKIKVVYDVENLEECLKSDFSFLDERYENKLVDSVKNYILNIS